MEKNILETVEEKLNSQYSPYKQIPLRDIPPTILHKFLQFQVETDKETKIRMRKALVQWGLEEPKKKHLCDPRESRERKRQYSQEWYKKNATLVKERRKARDVKHIRNLVERCSMLINATSTSPNSKEIL